MTHPSDETREVAIHETLAAATIADLERRLAFYERPTSKFVEVSHELVAEMLVVEWSHPVRFKLVSEEGNLLRLIVKDAEP